MIKNFSDQIDASAGTFCSFLAKLFLVNHTGNVRKTKKKDKVFINIQFSFVSVPT